MMLRHPRFWAALAGLVWLALGLYGSALAPAHGASIASQKQLEDWHLS